MLVVKTSSELRSVVEGWKSSGKRVGFVPTMGALHAGHLSLMQLAGRQADHCVVSIFVNPTQFAPHEDFASYPRNVDADLVQCKAAGVGLVYLPDESEIYPEGMISDIVAGTAAEGLESDSRAHFFDGVVNVVAQLFAQVQPDMAVFGEKDYQQLMVVREMVAMHGLPIEIVGAPIKRDDYGLALSSRNAYLSEEEMVVARQLNRILRVADGVENAHAQLLAAGFDNVDYVAERWDRILGAVWVGKTRLIDNLG